IKGFPGPARPGGRQRQKPPDAARLAEGRAGGRAGGPVPLCAPGPGRPTIINYLFHF
ncbi:Hypothetical predicted protein, partial [Olea europaea subsp. europaea]